MEKIYGKIVNCNIYNFKEKKENHVVNHTNDTNINLNITHDSLIHCTWMEIKVGKAWK